MNVGYLFKDISKSVSGKHTVGQCINLLKYKLSKKTIILNYDPLSLSIAATDRCNFQCYMCQTHSKNIGDFPFKHKPCKDMDFDLFKKIIDKFRNATSVSIVGTGEPLLNKDLFRMIKYAKNVRKMKVTTVSNGSFDLHLIDKILTSGLDSISISLNGHNSNEFERMTKMDKKFEVIVNNIKLLVERRNMLKINLNISCSFIVDQINYKNIPDMLKISTKLGIDHANFGNFLPSPFPGFTLEERCLTNNNKEAINFLSQLNISKYPLIVRLPQVLDISGKWRLCESHFTTLRVDGDGNIGGCGTMLLNLKAHIFNRVIRLKLCEKFQKLLIF
ncbi:hypothetical protein MSIBF_A480001 [groundwater metagenome]|uniref:Radical SAM core domain-containing protein n=1 Tax=groundwater metagenome TaxID=717931 RepID=A0A098ECR7_9ZZZZ